MIGKERVFSYAVTSYRFKVSLPYFSLFACITAAVRKRGSCVSPVFEAVHDLLQPGRSAEEVIRRIRKVSRNGKTLVYLAGKGKSLYHVSPSI